MSGPGLKQIPPQEEASLALVNQINGTKNLGRFGKNGITLFLEKFHRDEPFHLNSW